MIEFYEESKRISRKIQRIQMDVTDKSKASKDTTGKWGGWYWIRCYRNWVLKRYIKLGWITVVICGDNLRDKHEYFV